MALKQTIAALHELLGAITHDLHKAEGGNKAAAQRVRTGTIDLEKLAKVYRKESIVEEKKVKEVTSKLPKASSKRKPPKTFVK